MARTIFEYEKFIRDHYLKNIFWEPKLKYLFVHEEKVKLFMRTKNIYLTLKESTSE
jgi:hypothetical protein